MRLTFVLISVAAACGAASSKLRPAAPTPPKPVAAVAGAPKADDDFPDEQSFFFESDDHEVHRYHLPRVELLDAGAAPHAALRYRAEGAVDLELRGPQVAQKFIGIPAQFDEEGEMLLVPIVAAPDGGGGAGFLMTAQGQILNVSNVDGVGEDLLGTSRDGLVLLPNADVGVGARWRARRTWIVDGSFVLEEVTYTLASRDGDRATVDADSHWIWIEDDAVEAATGSAREDAARAAAARLHDHAFEDIAHVAGHGQHVVVHAALDLRAPFAGAITLDSTLTIKGDSHAEHVELVGAFTPPPPADPNPAK